MRRKWCCTTTQTDPGPLFPSLATWGFSSMEILVLKGMMDGPDHFVCPAYCTLLHRIIKPKLMLVPIKFAEPSDVCQKWGRGGAKI